MPAHSRRRFACVFALVLAAGPLPGRCEEPAAKEKPKPQRTANALGVTPRTGMFGLWGQGHKYAYVLDVSESMKAHDGAPLAAAKREILASIDTLSRLQQFEIVYYGGTPHRLDLAGGTGRQVFATDDVKASAHTLVAGLETEVSTQHEPALMMAVNLRADVIFFMTDGDDPPLSRDDLERIARANDAGAVIHVIQFGVGEPQKGADWMKKLAEQNLGEYKFVDVQKLAAEAKDGK